MKLTTEIFSNSSNAVKLPKINVFEYLKIPKI
jgi:hypothetical protein